MLSLTLLSLLFLTNISHAFDYCPLLGAVYPTPRNINSNALTVDAVASLTEALDKAVRENQTPYGNFSSASNSFSINAISVNEDKPIFQYHHTASLLDNTSTTTVTGDTVFRIGSISKLFTTFALLLQEGTIIFDDPVTKYIPELSDVAKSQATGTFDPVTEVQWKDVTVGALASQLAGIGREYNAGDLAGIEGPWVERGLPPLNGSDVPNCNVIGKYPACSRDAFFHGFVARHPVLAPFSTPVYSNAGFVILGFVVEKVTGQSYPTAIEGNIFGPLGMTHSSVTKPLENSQGIIPKGASVEWGSDFGSEGPAGGLYSSSNDLCKLARGILKSSQLLPVETRRWLKPHAHTASLRFSVGAPWEIQRVTRETSDHEVVDLYTKSGSTGTYHSLIVLIPDYDVAFAVLTAGDAPMLISMLPEMIAQTFIPLIYRISKEEAAVAFGGIYESTSAINSSLSLKNDDGPGFLIDRWISNGTDALASYQQLIGVQVQARVYPTGLVSPAGSGNLTRKVSWRAIFQNIPAANATYQRGQYLYNDCETWFSPDSIVYGHNALDEFVFTVDQHGNAISIQPRALRIDLAKKSPLSGGTNIPVVMG